MQEERKKTIDSIRSFHTNQRVFHGRVGENEVGNRKRQNSEMSPVEPYDIIRLQRAANKLNSDRTNFFINENEPEFINSMSRTMDAYDLRISTFGGK